MSSEKEPPGTAAAPARRYAGASAQERIEQRRERLLAAGFDVFGRVGYLGATMQMICAQARITGRYSTESFASLDELFREVHKRLAAEVASALIQSVIGQPDEPVAMVRAGLRAFFEYIKADPRRAQILLIDAVTTGLTDSRNAQNRAHRYADMLRVRFKQRYPHLPKMPDIDLIIAGFSGMVVQTASIWSQRGFDTPVEELVDHNAYAWAGLHQWLSSVSDAHAPGKAAPENL